MKEFTTCFFLWSKRILKRPLLLFSLLLMPCSVIFLQNCQTKQDALVRVALYTSAESNQHTACKLIDELVALSNSSITFYKSSTEESLRHDVFSGSANCGYILPENLDELLLEYVNSHKAFIKTIRPKKEVTTNIVDEIVLSKLYKKISYNILYIFLENKTNSAPDDVFLSQLFNKHADSDLLFQFEYADGTKNELLNSSQTNYMLMPIRGIVSVFVLLTCMAGSLLWYSDSQNGLVLLLDKKKQWMCKWLSLFVPGFFASIIGLVTIKMTGISQNLLTEIPAILLYLCSCIALTNFLRSVCQKRKYFLATIPIFVIGSFILCPVFIDLHNFLPEIAILNKSLPTTYYLNSIHSIKDSLYHIIYSALLLLASVLYQRMLLFLKK